ncbi:MAG: hypothetical protein IJA26_05560 [Clostridia bacterium]|nr:hypothetical protein [Clostridia bacterium]
MKIKRITAAVLILAVLTVAFGVWAITATVKNAQLSSYIAFLESNQPSTNVVSGYDADGIAAEFRGGVVTVGEAMAEYSQISAYYDMMGMDESEYADTAKQDVLEGLVEDKILQLKAQELGLYDVSEADHAAVAERVKADFDSEVEYYMSFRRDGSKTEAQVREETIEYLAQNGITLEGMIAAAEQDIWREKLYNHVTSGISATDEEVYALYEDQVAADEGAYAADYAQYEMDMTFGRTIAWHPEGIRRVDVVNIPFSAEQQNAYFEIQTALAGGDSAKLAEMDALYDELLPTAEAMLLRAQQGEDFAVLDAEAGDSYYPEGGVYVSANSTIYSNDFRDAAMGLANIGDISGLVYTDSGIAFIKYAGDVTPGAVPFEEIREQLKESCSAEVKSSGYNTQVFMWIKEAEVKYYPERF